MFRDQSPQFVIDTVQAAGLRAAQLHGHETPRDAAEIRPYVQALIVGVRRQATRACAHVDDYGADAVLLDSPAPGSGEVFDWSLAEGAPSDVGIILAGGLTPDERGRRHRQGRPWGVDVSTGVEVDGNPAARTRAGAGVHPHRPGGRPPVRRPSPPATAVRLGRVGYLDWGHRSPAAGTVR